MTVPLRLDHASVAVPDLAAAVEHLDRRLGLRATVSPGASDRHGRVYLDRSYLEVATKSAGRRWEASVFFLRFEDPLALRAHLDTVGIAHRFGEYEGVDGTWDDVELDAGPVPMPILVRRTAPPAVARDWPPALPEPHACGAVALAEVHVDVPRLDEALEAYRRLVGVAGTSTGTAERDEGRACVPLDTGRIVLHEAGRGGGLGLVIGVRELAATRAAIPARLGPAKDSIAWLDPHDTFGLRLGFAEPVPAT
jgi:hypothetical protein